MILNYTQYMQINEGGAAISSSRKIREDEVAKTLLHLEKDLFPVLGGGKLNKEYLLIGSIGKKENPDDTSGDVDLGVSKPFLARQWGVPESKVLDVLSEKLKDQLPDILGYNPEIKMYKGINIVSVEWPIEGDIKNGTVQLDLIPISDMNWAKFIFYSPDQRKKESKYKSAHRNWLFQAILSALKEVDSVDEDGQIMDYNGYVLKLGDGVFKNRKTFRGATKRLSRPKILEDSTFLVTRDPQKMLDLLFGSGVKPEDVKTFEDVWSLVKKPSFIHADKLESIVEDFVRYLERTSHEIPKEIKNRA
ncbi:hypothetical protein EBS02_00870 [bacterium]|nr:hypothetical protein [bacterium]